MEIEIAQSYVALYVELCLGRLSARPKGSAGISFDERPRLVGLLRNAEKAGKSPRAFVEGVVDQLRFEGRQPVHCLSVCGETGAILFRNYEERVGRVAAVEAATMRLIQETDIRDQIMHEIEHARRVMRGTFANLSKKRFEEHWVSVLSEKRADRRLRQLNDDCNVPAIFKYLAPEVWCNHGRTLPTVGDTYLAALEDPGIVKAFQDAFPRVSACANACRKA